MLEELDKPFKLIEQVQKTPRRVTVTFHKGRMTILAGFLAVFLASFFSVFSVFVGAVVKFYHFDHFNFCTKYEIGVFEEKLLQSGRAL